MADEFLKMDESVKELSKSPILALDALHGKFICAGGMTNAVYTKLYTTMVEPVLFYGAGIWGTKQYSLINSGADPGGAPGARPPKMGKNMIFWRKIVIFHTKCPNIFRASLRSAQFF